MSESCEDYYKELHASCGQVLSTSLSSDTAGLQAKSHSYIADLDVWLKAVASNRAESQLIKAAIAEYQFGLLAVVLGQYRQAFMALRLSLELLLGAVLFSTNELELRLWLKGKKDIVWSGLVNTNTGPLSKPFVTTFYEELADEAPHYLSMAEKVYRECSEYVHGNAHIVLDSQLVYQQPLFNSWHAKAKTIRLVTSFALCARYVGLADKAVRTQLEAVLLDNLGHLAPVRAALGVVVEQPNA